MLVRESVVHMRGLEGLQSERIKPHSDLKQDKTGEWSRCDAAKSLCLTFGIEVWGLVSDSQYTSKPLSRTAVCEPFTLDPKAPNR
jgi:hypothetical protein